MKLIISLFAFIVLVFAFAFAYQYFAKDDPLLTEQAKSVWLDMCGNNDKCQTGVKEHYTQCASSVSFQKPNTDATSNVEVTKMQRDLEEYYLLINVEIGSCLSDKTGMEFPVG